MPAMDVGQVLRRVDEDLARGHTFLAIQRLVTLVHGNAGDLSLRDRLAAVHLATGNWVEAGRWSYLSEVREERALHAFERAFPHPRARRDALRWSADDVPAVPAWVSGRLAELDREAERLAHRRSPPRIRGLTNGSRLKTGLWSASIVALVTANLALYALGLITWLRWVWQ